MMVQGSYSTYSRMAVYIYIHMYISIHVYTCIHLHLYLYLYLYLFFSKGLKKDSSERLVASGTKPRMPSTLRASLALVTAGSQEPEDPEAPLKRRPRSYTPLEPRQGEPRRPNKA